MIFYRMMTVIAEYEMINTLSIYHANISTITHSPMMFLPSDLLWENRIELVAMELYIMFTFPSRIFCWGVPGLLISFSLHVLGRGLASSLTPIMSEIPLVLITNMYLENNLKLGQLINMMESITSRGILGCKQYGKTSSASMGLVLHRFTIYDRYVS